MTLVLDVTVPTINHPEDVAYTEGQVGNSVTWQASDDNPTAYEVVRDSVIIKAGQWNSSSEQIVVSVDRLVPGVYEHVLFVFDVGGHVMSDPVLVTVIQAASTTTTTTAGPATPAEFPMTLVAVAVSVTSVAFAVIAIVMARKGILGHRPSG
jgi:hypothetical protein